MDIQQQFEQTYTLPSPYLGLQNIGSTCYMNSVLQTLFMTPEFRRWLYQWNSPQIQDTENEKDIIPFQLQKLFGRLQMKVFEFIDTRDLTKSFQWDVHQAFEQHDIQEFIRVLFDAIEQSIEDGHKNFIKELFEGINLNYTRCLKCGYESTRQENFLDYTLILKDKFSKVYNNSIEKALQVGMKPETLNGSNQYFCEQCQCKQDALRGTRILKVPPIFCIHINRFAFDYMLMKREKLDDYMSFPFVLNMNNFINGYDGIPNKISEQNDDKYFEEKAKRPQKVTFTAPTSNPFPPPPPPPNSLVPPPKNQQATQKSKKQAGSSTQTKSFLEEIRKNRKAINKQKDEIQIEVSVNQNEVSMQEAIEASLAKHTESEEIKIQIIQQEDLQKCHSTPEILTVKEQVKGKQMEQEQLKEKKEKQIDIEEDKKKYFSYIKQIYEKHNKEIDEKVKEYLKDGEEVYQLYSILNHTGGAFGGHYYAFIKSFIDGKWYNFNDAVVTGIDPSEIPKKAFGGSTNNNGYMLFYRKVDFHEDQFSQWGGEFQENTLPPRILQLIQEERKKIAEYIELGGNPESLQNQKLITLKVYYKLEHKLIQMDSIDTFEQLQNKAFQLFNINDKENSRLRAYVAHSDILTDTYNSRLNQTLAALKIQNFKTFSFQFRNPGNVWDEYDSSIINLRFTLWNSNITLAEEKFLEKSKLQAQRSWSVQDLLLQVQKLFGVQQQLLLFRRQQDYGLDIAKPITQGTVEELDLLDNQLLYVEIAEQGGHCWINQFDRDAHTVTVKFNHPDNQIEEFPYEITIDGRLKLMEMKEKMCKMIDLSPCEVIIRRGGRSGLEIKDLNQDIELSHFVKGSSVYLERGCPLNPGEYRCILYVCDLNNDPFEDRNIYNFTEVGELAVPGDKNLSTFKMDLVAHANRKLNLNLDSQSVWFREKISERLTKVYRDRPLKEQGILEKRNIAIQLQNCHEWLTPKEVLIVVRYWDQQKYELSEKFQIVVSKNQTCSDFAKTISEVCPYVLPENMEACRIVTIYKFNRWELMLEEWHSLNSNEQFIGSQPLMITNDGSLIIIKDSTQIPRDLTEEEQKQYGILQCNLQAKDKKKYPKVYLGLSVSNQTVEKSLKITVKKNNNEIKQEQSKQDEKQQQEQKFQQQY